MRTELGKKAFQHMEGFKSKCTPKQWDAIETGIKQFDICVNGSGFYAIQAKVKLEKMLEFTEENLKAFQFLNPN